MCFFKFLNCSLAALHPTLCHYWGDSLSQSMFITVVLSFGTKCHWESRNEIGSLSPAEQLLGLESWIVWFYHNALVHKAAFLKFECCCKYRCHLMLRKRLFYLIQDQNNSRLMQFQFYMQVSVTGVKLLKLHITKIQEYY